MAEEKPDGEFPRSDQAKDVPLATTPEADVSQDIIEDKAPCGDPSDLLHLD